MLRTELCSKIALVLITIILHFINSPDQSGLSLSLSFDSLACPISATVERATSLFVKRAFRLQYILSYFPLLSFSHFKHKLNELAQIENRKLKMLIPGAHHKMRELEMGNNNKFQESNLSPDHKYDLHFNELYCCKLVKLNFCNDNEKTNVQ